MLKCKCKNLKKFLSNFLIKQFFLKTLWLIIVVNLYILGIVTTLQGTRLCTKGCRSRLSLDVTSRQRIYHYCTFLFKTASSFKLPTLVVPWSLCGYEGRVLFTGCQQLREIATYVSGGVVVGCWNCFGEDALRINFCVTLLYFLSPAYDTPGE